MKPFKEFGFNIKIKTNLKDADFLSVMFDLVRRVSCLNKKE